VPLRVCQSCSNMLTNSSQASQVCLLISPRRLSSWRAPRPWRVCSPRSQAPEEVPALLAKAQPQARVLAMWRHEVADAPAQALARSSPSRWALT